MAMFDKDIAKATTTVDDIDSPLVKMIMERSVEDLMADYPDDDDGSTVDRDPATLVKAKDFDKEFLSRMREGAIKTVHEVFDPEWIKTFEETPYNFGGDQ